MAIFVEFTVSHTAFPLGAIFEPFPDATVELERVVPTGAAVIPFVWVEGVEADAVVPVLADDDAIDAVSVVEQVDGETLLRVDWQSEVDGIVGGIVETDATVLEATGDHQWLFGLRFPDRDALAAFADYCAERDIPVEIETVRASSAAESRDSRFRLTAEQREALVLALRRGYFETPSRTTMDDLADELGISQQATSQRIRRGTERLLRSAFRDGTGA